MRSRPKALIELYEREGDDAGLARTLRRQLELDARRLGDDPAVRAGAPREWPVGKRIERLTALRKLATMCETRLGDVDGVVYAASGVLEIIPGDRDALDRMARALEQAGDKKRLIQTLEYHAAAATGPAERAKIMRRLARMAVDDGDHAAPSSAGSKRSRPRPPTKRPWPRWPISTRPPSAGASWPRCSSASIWSATRRPRRRPSRAPRPPPCGPAISPATR
jgi:hypothetical protein